MQRILCWSLLSIAAAHQAASFDFRDGSGIVRAAKTQLGLPYSWGGGGWAGPSFGVCCSPSGRNSTDVWGFDCSGLSQFSVYQATGLLIPRFSGNQRDFEGCQKVPIGERAAGDLIFWNGHVAIIAGGGKMVEASGSKNMVVVSDERPSPFDFVRRCW